MNSTEKRQFVSALHGTFKEAETVVVVKQSGLSVAESTQLRVACRELDVGFKVAKNRLAKIALKGTKFEHLEACFKGPTAIAYSRDYIAASKAMFTFAKTNQKLTLLGGGMGEKVLSVDDIKAWGALPGLDALRGKIVGLLQAPGAQLARVLNAYAKQGTPDAEDSSDTEGSPAGESAPKEPSAKGSNAEQPSASQDSAEDSN